MKRNEVCVPLEVIVSKIAALGVPGIILTLTKAATGYSGAAAMTTALAAIGPGGMFGGVVTLVLTGLVVQGITEYGTDAILSGVIKELYKNGDTKESIKRKIKKYPISKKLKLKLYNTLEYF